MQITEASYHDKMPSVLSDIAHQSKAHWKYPTEWLDLWDEELNVSKKEILEHDTFVVRTAGKIIGFAMVVQHSDYDEIDHFWIHPDYIGQGYGGLLMREVLGRYPIKQRTLHALADPSARPFYEKSGFKHIQDIASSIPNRTLPLMVLQKGLY
ncbi:GNAT family N-acetyltransferase [Roseivirga sp.]|uniref:GNAT family N-acetyltransferase n=1 Tax=Roseivirga sp. TaxID=1964215 RepID=UPI003B520FB9